MGKKEDMQPEFSEEDGAAESAFSRFEVMPDADVDSINHLSIFKRMRQVFLRRGSQADDADSFFDNKLDRYIE